MKTTFWMSLLAAVSCASLALGAERKPMDLYLLIGQSNMAGRGVVEAPDQKEPSRVFTLNKANEWVPAVDPIHFDKKHYLKLK